TWIRFMASSRVERGTRISGRRTASHFLPASSVRLQLLLGAVLGVDTHVFVGKIGCPDRFTAVASTQLDADGDLFLGHYRRTLLFGITRGTPALAGNANFAEEHIDFADIQVRHSGTTDSGEDTAPVWVR